MESPLLAASPEDGYPLGFSLAEVPVVLGPMVPRDQTIVVSALNNTQHLLDIVTKPIKSHSETNFSTVLFTYSLPDVIRQRILFTGYISSL